jgi:hypothetical protein
MFQYAAAKSLAARLHTTFKLESLTSLQKDKQRSIALQDLNTHFELATRAEIKKFVGFPTLYRHKPRFFSRLGRNIYREPHFHYDPNFFSLRPPVFIDGFWQSPQYFQDIEPILREEFSVKEELIQNMKEKAREMQARSSVAVHIRRGDFLKPKIKAYHGVMSAFYFEKAIGIIREQVPDAYVYFFSDDIEWVKQNLVVGRNSEFISGNNNSAIEDFYLMSKCRHNVIANSSFSWWAAWLNDNPNKIVVAPQKWFAEPTIDTRDLIPREWIRI